MHGQTSIFLPTACRPDSSSSPGRAPEQVYHEVARRPAKHVHPSRLAGADIGILMSAMSRRDSLSSGLWREYTRRVPLYHRTYSPGQLQFITTSTYRWTPLFFPSAFAAALCNDWRKCGGSCRPVSMTSRTTASGSGAFSRSMCTAKRSGGRNWSTCTITRSNADWSERRAIGRGQVGGFTSCRMLRCFE